MMKTYFTLLMLLLTNCVSAQFAIIQSKDGYGYVSSKSEINNITDTLKNGHLIFAFGVTGHWTTIYYSKDKDELNGQINTDRVTLISTYQDIPILVNKDNKVILSQDSIKIEITSKRFDRSKYKLTFSKEYKDQLQYVNYRQYWGSDGEIPWTAYKAIDLFIGNRKFTLPQRAIDNLFNISLNNVRVNYNKVNDLLYIQSTNSDGAGSYQVIWKVEKGKFKERYIAPAF